MFAVMTTQRAIGYVFVAVVAIGLVFFVISQLAKGRKEAGSEIVLAANRGPGQSDDELEGKRLNLALWSAFGLLLIVGLSLPIYWLAEGGRQAGAVKDFQQTFIDRGLVVYTTKAQCVNCHGPKGVGGTTSYVITDDKGAYVQTVNWNAPALNTVLWRFSQDEVTQILEYGRPGTPMPAWGSLGGGPLSDQQLQDVIAYLWSVQLTQKDMKTEVGTALRLRAPALADRLAAVQKKNAPLLAKDPTAFNCTDGKFACLSREDNLLLGEILFNLTDTASGAYSCARCHIGGASFGESGEPVQESGRHRYGPNLSGIEYDMTVNQQFNLVMQGTEQGKIYGANHQGSGRMPGFGLNPNQGDTTVPQLGVAGMLSPEEVYAIVIYERNLDVEEATRAGQVVANVPAAAAATGAASGATTTTQKPSGSTTTTTQAGQ
jgi:mono/diheme cytochrome c family protein